MKGRHLFLGFMFFYFFITGLLFGMELEPMRFNEDVPVFEVILDKGSELLYMATPGSKNAAFERPSPNEWVSKDDIMLKDGLVSFQVDGLVVASDDSGVYLPTIANTNSMDPVIDETSKLLKVKPDSMDKISVGDIITYKKSRQLITHRVVYKGTDEDGLYFVAKGDNVKASDPGKIRSKQILYVTVGVLY